MKYVTFLLLAISFLPLKVYTQTVEPSKGIDKSFIQIETQFQYSSQKEGNTELSSYNIPSFLIRYGLSNTVELQLNTPIIKESHYENDHLTHSLHKFDDIQIGFSLNLWNEIKFIPETALMVRAILPIEKNTQLNDLGTVVSLNFSNTLSNKLSLTNNIGFVSSNTISTTGFYISNLCYQYSPQINLFIETFGDFSTEHTTTHNINIGGGYSINNNLCLGVFVANGINHNLFQVGGLLNWTINTKKS